MSTALVAAGAGGLTVATNAVCNGIVQCMDASANNRMRVDRQKFDHELDIHNAQSTRAREQNQHEIKIKILELGAQNNDAFNSIIENAESHGKKGIPALIESMGLDKALALLDSLKSNREKQDAIRDRFLS